MAGLPPKSQQSQKSSQWTPGSPKRAPGPLKSLKITRLTSQSLENQLRTARFLHFCDQYFLTTGLENIGKHNCQNANKKRNGTVAGYARNALDIYIYIYIYIRAGLPSSSRLHARYPARGFRIGAAQQVIA